MEQKVMIEVGTTELQKALDKMIEGIVMHEMRAGVEKIIAENFEKVMKPRLEHGYIDSVVRDVVKSAMGYDYYSNLRKKANDEITTLATESVRVGLSAVLQEKIVEGLKYTIGDTVRANVNFEVKKFIKEEAEAQVKEMIKDILAKAIMGK